MTVVFPQILLVDDDPILVRTLQLNLERDGFQVAVASNGQEALKTLERRIPDLMLVDLLLPDMHGFELSRRVKQYLDVPIIMVTAVGAEDSVVKGIESYAEDYVVKPFNYRELLARLNRILKRTRNVLPEGQIIKLGSELVIDFARHVVAINGQERRLTPTEERLLAALARNLNRVVPKGRLIDETWPDGEGDPPRLWVNIQRIRRKLEPQPDVPRYLITEANVGYKLVSAT
ncbi:MAG TPA: response regulator transcription factor [Dehalococcoidia bacterium]|nr:response regulator transcription factor [Dehalococcoidia bacterium]